MRNTITSMLVIVEMRRALHRRVTWVLIALAVTGAAVMGVVAFFDAGGKTAGELLSGDGDHPAVMANWWVAAEGSGVLTIAAVPLLIGGLLGGASVAGAEWRAGTVTTVLTWEPRRLRVHAARAGATFLLAVAVAVVLQAVFLGAAAPAVLAHGTTAGVDAGWWTDLALAAARVALLTGGSTLLGVSLATLSRSTGFAVGVAFGWVSVGENLVRNLKPSLQHLLVGDNLALVLTWGRLGDVGSSRSEVAAALTLTAYFAAVAAVAAAAFVRCDVAAAS